MAEIHPITVRAASSASGNAEHAIFAEQLGNSGNGSALVAISANGAVPTVTIRGAGVLLDLRNSANASVAQIAQDGTITVQGVEVGGGGGGSPTGSAGGSLAGTYPNPTIAAGVIGGTEVAAAIKDPIAATAGLRTLGAGSVQAAAGNHAHTYAPRIRVAQAYITDGSGATLPDTSGSWAAVSGFLLPIPAAVGDYVDIGVHAMRGFTAAPPIDIGVMVSATIVRFMATGTNTPAIEGDPGWYLDGGYPMQSAPRGFTVTSDDLSGGNVTFALVTKAAGAGTVHASSNFPFYWRAMNYGPLG